MQPAYRVADVRVAEAAVMSRVPPDSLMAVAARGLAVATMRWLEGRGRSIPGADVVVLVGSGNNGGDALYAAAHLGQRGARVTVVTLSSSPHPGGLAAAVAAGARVLPATDSTALERATAAAAGADVVLDGIVGIGGSGALRPPADALAAAAQGHTIAVDLPSGVDPDTGVVADPQACVAAEVTVTFGVLKPGLVLPEGSWRAGLLHLVDIGLSPELADVAPVAVLMDAPGAARRVPVPQRSDDKYTRGVVGVVAGSQQYPGAGILCTGAARFGGVGMVRYAGGAGDVVVTRWPEVVPTHGKVDGAGRVEAWIVGPGAGTDDDARRRLAEAVASDVPLLVDADGITLVAEDPALRDDIAARAAPTLFTPHAGEFARLGGTLDQADGRLAAVRELAANLGSVVLLKGAATVVAGAEGTAAVSASGPPELATAGSGDVLSGLIGSMLAAGNARAGGELTEADVVEIAAAGAYLHGLAARLAAEGGRPIVSEDVLASVPTAIAVARQSEED
ncbi:MAG: NAD(P)H-hydrate dehydratase [Actinobacteria bacterium]|nr:NAD(P)H-hydrate dehydratase [Actinomycetota bacterium]MCB9412037.1 NAD(P)H-hydrate dehydratase [Actinomycetota bacterium]